MTASEALARLQDCWGCIPAIAVLRAALAAKDAEIARLTKDNGELEEVHLRDAAYEIGALKSKVAALTEERDGLRTLADDLLARLTEVQTDNETLTTAHAALREAATDLLAWFEHDLRRGCITVQVDSEDIVALRAALADAPGPQ